MRTKKEVAIDIQNLKDRLVEIGERVQDDWDELNYWDWTEKQALVEQGINYCKSLEVLEGEFDSMK